MSGLDKLPQPIQDYIIQSVQKDYPSRKDNELYVSELLGHDNESPCLRKAYLRRRIGDKPKTIKSAFGLYRGNLFDAEFTPLFDRQQQRVTYRIPATPIVISGKCDFIHDGVVYDLKTAKNLFFIKKPKPEHVDQVNFYAYNLAMDKGALLYMDFGDALTFELDCSKAFGIVQKIADEGIKLYHYLNENTMPPKKKLTTKNKWECEWCDHAEECFNHEAGK